MLIYKDRSKLATITVHDVNPSHSEKILKTLDELNKLKIKYSLSIVPYYELENMKPLQEKTLALIIQLPPSMQIMPGLEGLKELVGLLDGRFRYAVKVRHSS
jgi:Protein of unknown function DUF72